MVDCDGHMIDLSETHDYDGDDDDVSLLAVTPCKCKVFTTKLSRRLPLLLVTSVFSWISD